ncbi:MAG: hypothetical protein QOH12_3508 [Solirubrobacteraceae bacterium]|nr:hypothetical protein [Solirubrobacteraceae bacterium]
MAARSPELLRYLWARSASRSLQGRPGRWRPGEESIRELGGWVASWVEPPALSVCIVSRDRLDLLGPCVASLARTSYGRAVEVVIGDTGSSPATREFYAAIGVRAIDVPGPFNYSRACNELARAARADRLVFLNNDTEAISIDWLDRLLGTPRTELAGAILVYPSTWRVQHAGVEVQPAGGWLRPNSYRPPRAHRSEFALAHIGVGRRVDRSEICGAASVMAVTGALLCTSREQWVAAGGFDEAYETDLQDTDYCLRCRALGFGVVCRHDVVFSHRHSGTRGRYAFPVGDWEIFEGRWRSELSAWQKRGTRALGRPGPGYGAA